MLIGYAVVPVTVENAPPGISYGGRKIGKGNQLRADANDFPTLARTGLHSLEEPNRTERITGKPIETITAIGRPGSSSGEGFMAADEDILSVPRGDNRLVQRLGLTHPETAKPLFHIWNVILKEYELGRVGRRYDNVQYALYNGKRVRLGEVHPTRGFQESIFNDEIMGAFDISLFRDLDGSERAFLGRKDPNLNEGQMAELVNRLPRIRTGEMEPYYVIRYGFCEGHTSYRVDPIPSPSPSSSACGASKRSRPPSPADSTRPSPATSQRPPDSRKPHVTVTDRHAGSNPVFVCPTLEGNV